MRRLTRRSLSTTNCSSKDRDSQKGAASIMVAVLVVALLGCAALAVDNARLHTEEIEFRAKAEAAEQSHRFLAELIPQQV